MLKNAALIVTLVTLIALPVHAAEETLLVRLETRSFDTDREDRSELLIYRDGQVSYRSDSRKGTEASPVLRFVRGRASENQMRALGDALAANRVGLQSGECFLRTQSVHTFLLQKQVDWYGKGLRQNSFAADTRFPSECGTEVYAIVAAIMKLLSPAVLVDDRMTTDLLEDP